MLLLNDVADITQFDASSMKQDVSFRGQGPNIIDINTFLPMAKVIHHKYYQRLAFTSFKTWMQQHAQP